MSRYKGRVVAPVKDRQGWVSISSVQKLESHYPDLKTDQDIYVHEDSLSSGAKLRVGMEIEFDVDPDEKRGDGTYRVTPFAEETSKSRLEALASGGVTLSVGGLGESHTLAQPSVFVSWCISAEVAARIRDARLQGAPKPRLLILDLALDSWDTAERRYLVDLDAPVKMTTIEFTSSGKHRIYAVVTAEKDLLARKNGSYVTSVLNYRHDGLSPVCSSFGTTCLDVVIPQGIFAEKPRDWAWVNRWYDEPPFDQCAFRRRRLFAYGLQWELMAIGYLLLTLKVIGGWFFSAILAAICLFLGMRGIDTKSLLHPWVYGPKDMDMPTGGSVFWPLVEGQPVPFAILLHPVSLVELWFLAKWMGLENVFGLPHVGWAFLMFVTVIASSLWALGVFIRWMNTSNPELDSRRATEELERAKLARSKRERAEELKTEAHRVRVESEVAALICDATGPQEPSVEHLVLSFKTIRFHAEAFKRKVCRPFGA